MPKRNPTLETNEIYHVFNRGVEKRKVFLTDRGYRHFLETIEHYLAPTTKLSRKLRKGIKHPSDVSLVEILCYVLMPNHFHFLIRQKYNDGISTFMRKASNSFTRYFNVKNERIGPLFQGRFKAIRIETDEQLLHVSRYIHLNPVVSDIVGDLEDHQWSSYPVYIGLVESQNISINPQDILSHFSSNEDYKKFVTDQTDYAKNLEEIKHHLLD
ncbi:MAG TPA: transposase [Candidatus Nanoarchaeia archaeon]